MTTEALLSIIAQTHTRVKNAWRQGKPADWSETFRKVFVLPPENRKIPEDT